MYATTMLDFFLSSFVMVAILKIVCGVCGDEMDVQEKLPIKDEQKWLQSETSVYRVFPGEMGANTAINILRNASVPLGVVSFTRK